MEAELLVGDGAAVPDPEGRVLLPAGYRRVGEDDEDEDVDDIEPVCVETELR